MDGAIRVYETLRDGPGSGPKNPFHIGPTVVSVRGTDFMATHNQATGETEVVLYEGEVDVWAKDNPDEVHALTAGMSVAFTDGVMTEKNEDAKWSKALKEHDLPSSQSQPDPKYLESHEDDPIDPDAIFSESAAFGDLVEEVEEAQVIAASKSGGGGNFLFYLIIIVVIGGGVWWLRFRK